MANFMNIKGTTVDSFKIGPGTELIFRSNDEWTLSGSPGSAGDVITSNGAGSAPTWQASASSLSIVTTMAYAGAI